MKLVSQIEYVTESKKTDFPSNWWVMSEMNTLWLKFETIEKSFILSRIVFLG